MVSTASATNPIRINLTPPQADELTMRFNDVVDGDPVQDASHGMRVRFHSLLYVHDPAAALAELDNALDIIGGNLQPGIGDAQERARWRGQQRAIQNVRAKLVEAAASRQRPASRPGVTAAATLLDNGDLDESTPEARRVAFEARATAAWGVSDTDAMLALLREAGVEQPEVELDRLRQRLRPADHVAAIMARYDAHQAHTRPASPPPSRNVLATAGTLHNRHGLADHLRRATMVGTRLEDAHRQALAGVLRWLDDRTEHAHQVREPYVPLEMDRHAVAHELVGLAAELDGRPEGAWMTSPADGRLVEDLQAMAALLDEGAGYAARGRFAEASRQARNSYFTEQRQADLVEALRDAGSADPEADASFVYHGDPRRQYQLDTATDRLTNVLTRLNPDRPGGDRGGIAAHGAVCRRRPAGTRGLVDSWVRRGCGRGPGSAAAHLAAGRADAPADGGHASPGGRRRARGDPENHRPGGVAGVADRAARRLPGFTG